MIINERYVPYGKPIAIESAGYIGDFVMRIQFSDGHEQLVDFKSFLIKSQHPTIRKYLDEHLFRHFVIVDDNLNWKDFDLIFPLADLYRGEIMKPER